SYPLPPNVCDRRVIGSTFAQSAMLLIRVDEDPKPQSRAKSNLVVTLNPRSSAFVLKNSGLFCFAILRRLLNRLDTGFLEVFEIEVNDSKVNVSSNQMALFSSKLIHCISGSEIVSTSKCCPRVVGNAKASAPSKTTYSPVIKSLPLL